MRIMARTNVGGPALQATILMGGLSGGRFEQGLYAGSPEGGEADFLEIRAPDVPVYRVPTMSRRVRLGNDLRALGFIVSEMRKFRPHIVHTHTAKAGVAGRLAAMMTHVPVRVHTFHGHLLHGYFSGAATRGLVMAESALARHNDRLGGVAAQVRDDRRAARIGTPPQYVLVPTGTSFGPLPGRPAAPRARGWQRDDPVL